VQEAKAASALNHLAIVTIYEVATSSEDGAPLQYIAMEYVEGISLRQYFHEKVALPKLLEVIVEVAEGMASAHAAGVVHRDLKPDNIMMTADRTPKIVDFGLAKLMQPELLSAVEGEGAPTLILPQSNAGMVIGTVGYMSPEQVEGRPADHRSDIFSLGCILYEAVTGRIPFPGTSVVEVLHQILNSEPPPIAEVSPAAPVAIDRIVRRCLAKDPDERYQSIKEVAIELRQVLRDRDALPARKLRKRNERRLLHPSGALRPCGVVAAKDPRWDRYTRRGALRLHVLREDAQHLSQPQQCRCVGKHPRNELVQVTLHIDADELLMKMAARRGMREVRVAVAWRHESHSGRDHEFTGLHVVSQIHSIVLRRTVSRSVVERSGMRKVAVVPREYVRQTCTEREAIGQRVIQREQKNIGTDMPAVNGFSIREDMFSGLHVQVAGGDRNVALLHARRAAAD
jgi:serine/threonine protein kinase